MKELTAFGKLLGEENEKRFRDEVTNILIGRFQEEIDSEEECILDLDELVGEIMEELKQEIKNKVYQTCVDRVMDGIQPFAFVKKVNEEQ